VERLALEEVHDNFADVVMLVANGRRRILVETKGADRAAFISLEDLALLESFGGGKAPLSKKRAVSTVKRNLARDLARVADGHERIVLRENDADVMALVPIEDVNALETLDNRLDLEAAKRLLEKEMDGTA
jgi:PHD/YefM family antitoxin component YafN of YafNO toxin-antitoxin module